MYMKIKKKYFQKQGKIWWKEIFYSKEKMEFIHLENVLAVSNLIYSRTFWLTISNDFYYGLTANLRAETVLFEELNLDAVGSEVNIQIETNSFEI